MECSNPYANNYCPREELVAVLLKVTHGKDVSKTYKNVLPFSIQKDCHHLDYLPANYTQNGYESSPWGQ
jgi:hypothetical protein